MTFRSHRATSVRFSSQRGRARGLVLQRRCACGNQAESAGECSKCAERDGLLQRKSRAGGALEAPSIVHDVLQGSGQPLDADSRTFMESRFGYDFSQVRVHSGAQAHRSAEETSADAYTVGNDIVFASGRYAPATDSGRRLLAHELTHVVQQDSSSPVSGGAITMGRADEHETAADEAANAVTDRGESAAISDSTGLGLQRQESTGTPSTSGAAAPATAAPTPTAGPCLEDVVGEDIPSLLQAGAVTIIEFGADWCGPCKQNKAGLETMCRRFRAQPTPVTVRFYSIDVDDAGNKEAKSLYAPGGIPHLYFYVGSTERAHYNQGIEPDAMEQIVGEQVKYASTSGAARGAWSGFKWGALAGLGAGIGAAFGVGFGSGLEGNALMGGILGAIGGGVAVGMGVGAAIGAGVGAAGDDRNRGPKQQKRKRLQPKSRRGRAGDPLEREADEWAARISDEDSYPRSTAVNSRDSNSRSFTPSRGEPLDTATRGQMEGQFGRDFSGVRVHRDPRAEAMTSSMDAYAVTNDSDIYFASDGYAPTTRFGRSILGHELAHVAQNESTGPSASVSRLESEATRAATAVSEGRQAHIHQASNQPALAITRGEKTAAGAAIGGSALGAAGALIGLGVASKMSGTPYLSGLAVGGLIGIGVGALVGGLIGYFTRRTDSVESAEAESVIRRRFGNYLPGGVGPLNNAAVHSVDHAELCTWMHCRFGDEMSCARTTGWTDTGREPPNQIESAADEPVCSNGRRIEHATPAHPVIYFDRNQRDAGLMLHEGLHAYTHPSFGAFMRNEATEGTTEFFTRQLLDDVNIGRGSIYDTQLAEVNRLVPIVGEEKLRRAYFLGEMDSLSQTADQVMGRCALFEWAIAVQTLNFDRDKPRQIIEGRNQNYCRGDESSSAAPVAAPPGEGSTA